MRIPEKVTIAHKEYTVTLEEDHVIHNDTVCYGCIEYDKGIIKLASQYCEDQQKCTLIHEILHGIDNVFEINLEEDQVRQLAKGLYLFIKNNPVMFKEKGSEKALSFIPTTQGTSNSITIDKHLNNRLLISLKNNIRVNPSRNMGKTRVLINYAKEHEKTAVLVSYASQVERLTKENPNVLFITLDSIDILRDYDIDLILVDELAREANVLECLKDAGLPYIKVAGWL